MWICVVLVFFVCLGYRVGLCISVIVVGYLFFWIGSRVFCLCLWVFCWRSWMRLWCGEVLRRMC